MKKQYLFRRRIASAIIDLAFIYCISIILKYLLNTFVFADFTNIFVVALIGYYTLTSMFINGRTPAKILTGLKVVQRVGNPLSAKNIVLREIVLKGIIGIFIPLYLIRSLFPIWNVLFTVACMFIVVLATLAGYLLQRIPWWEKLSGTNSIAAPPGLKTKLTKSILAILSATVIAIALIVYPFLFGSGSMHTSFYPKYPHTKETVKYAAYIDSHKKDPVDYIFKLFEQYDVVVISERMHPEYTQYDFISKLISDKRFAQNVGNILTECGSVSMQDTLQTYVKAKFSNESELNKATAMLQRNSNAIWPLWSNTNLFDLLKTVNQYNKTNADSAGINWYFTDLPVDWRTATNATFLQSYKNPARDSFMAATVVNKYNNIISKQPRHKAIVIMNTRHGYGQPTNKEKAALFSKYNDATSLMMQKLPGKVANVLINTVSLKYGYFFVPVQNGKWETAFEIAGNPNAGFDFADSPFGNDNFDLAFFNSRAVTYKDVFTGFVFYTPLNKHIKKDGFPFEFTDFEDTILKRAAVVDKSQVEFFKTRIAITKNNPDNTTITEVCNYAVPYNLLNTILVPVILFIVLLLSLIFYFKQKKIILMAG